MKAKEYSLLLKFVGKLLKYYLFALLGFAVICILSAGMGAIGIASMLLSLVGEWLLRIALFNVCLVGVAAMVESLRQ